MIEAESFFEECQEECRELAHRWHARGLTLVIGYHDSDPKTDGSRTSYTTAGDYMACLGVAVWLQKALLNPEPEDEDEEDA